MDLQGKLFTHNPPCIMNAILKPSLILFLSAMTLGIPGRVAVGQNTSIGLKAGPNLATIAERGADQRALGFRVGGFLTYSIVREFGVGAELNLARKGVGGNGNANNLTLDYLEIPVMAHYFLLNEGPLRPKIMAGGYYGHLLQAKQGEQEFDSFEDQDYGLLAGIGLHYSLGNRQWLYVDLRYTHGLAEILLNTSQANRDLSLNVGISFPLEGK